MEITEQTPDVLIVHQGAWTMRMVGAAGVIVGAGVAALLHNASPGALHGSIAVGYAVSGVFFVLGSVLLAKAADRLVAFDRAAGVVRLITRGLRGRTVTEYPLASVRDVALEAKSGEHFMEYRPVLVLIDGRQIPWTSIMTSATRGQTQCVAAARAFGGWQGATAALPLAPSPRIVAVPRGAVVIAGVLLAVFACAGLGIYGFETYRALMWRPVQATVMSTAVSRVGDAEGGTSYRPAVTYWYRVGGAQYVATGVTPITISAGRAWATALSARFPVGARVTAYVDPNDPGKAFLVHEASLLPLWFVAIAALMAAGLTLAIRQSQRRQLVATSALGVPIVSRSVAALR